MRRESHAWQGVGYTSGVSLRIACDLDGTLANMEAALQREAEQLFGSAVDLRAGSPLPLTPPPSPRGADDAAAGGVSVWPRRWRSMW